MDSEIFTKLELFEGDILIKSSKRLDEKLDRVVSSFTCMHMCLHLQHKSSPPPPPSFTFLFTIPPSDPVDLNSSSS